MTKIHRKMEYALMSLKILSSKESDGLISVKEICDFIGCPYDGMAKVMQIMGQDQRILVSEQGVSGGYRLNADLSEVSVYQLMEMVLGPVEIAKCLQQNKSCDLISTCNILSPIGVLNAKITEFYKTLSIAEILESAEEMLMSSSVIGSTHLTNTQLQEVVK